MNLTPEQRQAALAHLATVDDDKIAQFVWATNLSGNHGPVINEVSALYCDSVVEMARFHIESDDPVTRGHATVNIDHYGRDAARLRAMAAMGGAA